MTMVVWPDARVPKVPFRISDAHPRLTAAIEAGLLGASWQRCRVHAMRNALGLGPKGAQHMVAAAIRSIFEQPDDVGEHGLHKPRRLGCPPASRLLQPAQLP